MTEKHIVAISFATLRSQVQSKTNDASLPSLTSTRSCFIVFFGRRRNEGKISSDVKSQLQNFARHKMRRAQMVPALPSRRMDEAKAGSDENNCRCAVIQERKNAAHSASSRHYKMILGLHSTKRSCPERSCQRAVLEHREQVPRRKGSPKNW